MGKIVDDAWGGVELVEGVLDVYVYPRGAGCRGMRDLLNVFAWY